MSTSPDATAGRWREHLLRMSAPLPEATILRVNSTKYQIAYRQRGHEWVRFDLLASSAMSSPPPGGHTLLQLNQIALDLPWLSVDHLDGSVVHTGAGWLGDTANTASYGGSYRQNNTGTGDYVEWTSPATATRLGFRTVAVSNAGIAKVTINGSATAANLLPTAQQLVDAGKLASTALVAGGGTLNPTDRVLDLYSGASSPGTTIDYDRHFALADGLAPGAHVVRITVTGYQNVAAGGFRLYTSGFTHAAPSTALATAGAELLPLKRVLSQFDSAAEYAHEFAPPGSSTYTYVGNIHGYEAPGAVTFYVDGQAVTLADGQRLTGSSVEVVRTSELRHSATGTTKHADVTTVYRVGREGIAIDHKTTWATACTLRRSYPAMLPLNGDIFTRGSFVHGGIDHTLTANNGTYVGKTRTDTIYTWDPTGDLAAILHLPDLAASTNNWSDSAADLFASIEDRTPQNVNAGNLSKLYMTRNGPTGPATVTSAGLVQRSRAVYRIWRQPAVNEALTR